MRIKFLALMLFAVLAMVTLVADLRFASDLIGGAMWIAAHFVLGGVYFALAAIPHVRASGLNGAIVTALTVGLMAGFAAFWNDAQRGHRPVLRRVLYAIQVFGGLAILLLGSIAVTSFALHATKLIRSDSIDVPQRSWTGVAIGNARQLTNALHIYAAQNNGNFPRHLGALVEAGILSSKQFDKYSVAFQSDGLPTPWIYFNGLHESDSHSVPLLMDPLPRRGGKRIVAFKDGSVDLIHAGQYDEVVTRWKMLARRH